MIWQNGARRWAALPVLIAGGLLLAAACGDDDGADPRVAQIGGVSELATYAYTDAGAEGLYDYLSADVTTACTKAQVTAALTEHEQPTGWQQIKDVSFQDADNATGTVILIYGSERQEEEWLFVREGMSWRIDWVAGLENYETSG